MLKTNILMVNSSPCDTDFFLKWAKKHNHYIEPVNEKQGNKNNKEKKEQISACQKKR